jgi:hypothetical protein
MLLFQQAHKFLLSIKLVAFILTAILKIVWLKYHTLSELGRRKLNKLQQ